MAGRRIYVGNLPFELADGQPPTFQLLVDLFQPYGTLTDAYLAYFRGTGRCRGFGFVQFATVAEATRALVLHGVEFHGRPLVVELAGPRSRSTRLMSDNGIHDRSTS